MGSRQWSDEIINLPLEDAAGKVVNIAGPNTPRAQDAAFVIQMRAALETSRAADAANKTALATRRLAVATWIMAVATLLLAVVTTASVLGAAQ